jgi:TonB family protein
VDLTILRSGVPESVPGRALDIGEGGLGAVLAADLRPGDSVGVEFHLPDLGLGLHAKAVIRHQAELRYGLEFLGLPTEQLAMLRYWINRAQEIRARQKPAAQPALASLGPAQLLVTEAAGAELRGSPAGRVRMLSVVLGLAFLASVVIAGGGWWQWHRAWRELESRIPERLLGAAPPHARVPADVMQQLLTYKVEPVYPQAAGRENMQGVVLLDVVVTPDGRVGEVRPLSGPTELAPAAVDAVRWWRFQPYYVKGHPAQVDTTLAIAFRPAS